MKHVVGIVHEAKGVYGLSFPDLPGCIAAGESLDEAMRKGRAAARVYAESLIEDGEPLPVLRSLDQLKSDRHFLEDSEDGMIVAVPVDLPSKAIRINISLDENLAAAVDRAAERAGLSRSAFLAEAAKEKLGEG
jgi:predicted RNase H-like HicB family nuclease